MIIFFMAGRIKTEGLQNDITDFKKSTG